MLRTLTAQKLALVLAASTLVGCGASPSTSYRMPASGTQQVSGTGSAGTQNPGTSPSPSPLPENKTTAPQSFILRGVGYGSLSFKVRTRSILKLRMTPGQQDQKISTTPSVGTIGDIPYYSKLGTQITVNGYTFATEMLDNGFSNGGRAQIGSLIDFNGRLPKGCADQGEDCRQEITVTVDKPNNDYYCVNQGQYCSYSTHVPDGHPWNATLQVQTDDTAAL